VTAMTNWSRLRDQPEQRTKSDGSCAFARVPP
jgi:hypothetical protein